MRPATCFELSLQLSKPSPAIAIDSESESGPNRDSVGQPEHCGTATVGSFPEDSLPDEPLFSIVPQRGWVGLNLRELWAYRELLYFLTWRDIKVRYKQTVLGVAWAIIQPVVSMVVFTLFFGKLAHMPSDGIPYPIFAYAGLLPWTFVSNAVSGAGDSLVGSAALVTKVYFPRLVIPFAAVCAALVDFAIASVVLFGMMIWYGMGPHWAMLMLAPLALTAALLAAAVGMWMSALNVKYRDVRYALPFLIQIWMFVTPIIYPATIVPERWRWLLAFNPLTGVIEGFRSALFGRSFNWGGLGAAAAITLVGLVYAAYAFRRMEREFADIV
jgi:homopolymeric O-antigen transport system permease protein